MSEQVGSLGSRLLARVPAAVYLAWLAVFVWLLGGGRYRAYLHPSLWPFVLLAVVLSLAFLLSVLLHRPSPHGVLSGEETWLRGALLLLPLVFMGAAREHALGTYALQKRRIGLTTVKRPQKAPTTASPVAPVTASPATSVAIAPGTDATPSPSTATASGPPTAVPAAAVPDKETPLTKLTEEVEKFKGKTVLTEGLVYKGEDLPAGYILVFRFLVTCCIADAQPVGVLVACPNAADLENDDWVRVVGRFDTGDIEGEEAPFIKATAVTRKKAPAAQEQYLYY